MSGTSNRTTSANTRRARKIKVAPVTRAIRSVLAISAAALALGGTGSALAANCLVPSANPIFCNSQVHDATFQPVIDLTTVALGSHADSFLVGHDGSAGWSGDFGLANNQGISSLGDANGGDASFAAPGARGLGPVQSLTDIGGGTPGPGGVSGADDDVGASVIDPFGPGMNFGVTAFGPLVANSASGFADALFVQSTGGITNAVGAADLTADGYTWAAGIEAEAATYANYVGLQASHTISATASGDNGYAWGIYAVAPDDVSLYNDGTINAMATGNYGTATGLFAYASDGTASADNTGTINATTSGYVGQAWGIYANGYSDTSASNTGSIYATASNGAVFDGGNQATGISVYSSVGMAYAYNGGDVHATASGGGFYGNNQATGISVASYGGAASAFNYGDIYATASGGTTFDGNNQATGISVGSYAGTAYAYNGGYISASASGGGFDGNNQATGISVTSYNGAASAFNYGDIYATASGGTLFDGNNQATGISVTSYSGAASANNGGTISTYAGNTYSQAMGVFAASYTGDVTLTNTGSISALAPSGYATGMFGYSYDGDVTVDNSNYVYAGAAYGAIAVGGYSYNGNVSVGNAGGGFAYAYSSGTGSAIGLYGYSYNGDVSIDNSGIALAYSVDGLADGIFASGVNVDVTNSGDVTAISQNGYWAAGIEAQGDDLTTVVNDGSIFAYTSNIGAPGYAGAESFGIYATGGAGGVQVTAGITSFIQAVGPYATGIYVQSGGASTVTNAGVVLAGGAPFTYYATGIHAASNYPGGDVSVVNSGYVGAASMIGSTGIEVLALGSGSNGSVTNSGTVYSYQSDKYGNGAVGIVVSSDGDATIDNLAGGVIVANSGGAAYGALALSFAGDANVTNAGDVYAYSTASAYRYSAYGIVAGAQNGSASVDNSGGVTVQSTYFGGYIARGIDASSLNGTTVTNSGAVSVEGYYAYGVLARTGDGDTVVSNTVSGNINVQGGAFAFGVLGLSTNGDVAIDNAGYIYSYAYGQSVGVFARSTNGDVAIDNSGTLVASSYNGPAMGLFASGVSGDVSVNNSGLIAGVSPQGDAIGARLLGNTVDVVNSGYIYGITGYGASTGLYAFGNDSVTIDNEGLIAGIGKYANAGQAEGIYAVAINGDVTVTNGAYGLVGAISQGDSTQGVFAYSVFGNSSVDNAGNIQAYGYSNATGITAGAGDAGSVSIDNSGYVIAESIGNKYDAIGIEARAYTGAIGIDNSGDVQVHAYNGFAMGVTAQGYSGDIGITNGGNIEAIGYYGAVGIQAQSTYGNIDINSSGMINAYSYVGAAIGIIGQGAYGNVTAANSGDITASTVFSVAIGVAGISYYGDVNLDNSGTITASTAYAPAFGLYGYSYYGNVSANNSGTIYAYSFANLADGIFASGVNVDVTNSGDITAISQDGYWAAGIEAQGDDLTTVSNDGSIYAYTSNIGAPGYAGAESFGIYATGGAGGVQVTTGTSSSIEAQGPYAFGIYVQSGGAVNVTNAGGIIAGTGSVGYTSIGIHAANNYPGSDIVVDNSGSIYAGSYYGGTGIEVLALGAGSNGSVTNSGTISAYEGGGATYGGIGILVSTDNNADIDNSGSITAVSAGSKYANAYGALALAFAGDATVTNSGDITAYSAGFISSGAYGIVSAAQNGQSFVDNSGMIDATSGKYAQGIQASSLNGTTVTNSGLIHADGKYAYGVFATSGQGDVSVNNSAGGFIDSYSYGGYGTGIFAQSTLGDVSVGNAGGIDVYGYSQAVGVFARASAGDVSVGSSGSVDAYSYGGPAVGVFASAANGNAAVNNSGAINASAYYAEADGILASGLTVGITNSGDITATGGLYGNAYGINVYGLDSATVNNSGTITANAYAMAGYGYAFGVYAKSGGDVTISNSGSIDAAAGYMYATGIYGGSLYGDVSITNSGAVSAYSPYSLAVGVAGASYFGDVALGNSGTIDVASRDVNAIGMLGNDLYGNTTITTAAGSTINATAANADATGIFGISILGNVAINSAGSITADGYNATGIYANALYAGSVTVNSSGSILATAYDRAEGIYATAYGDVNVANSGSIQTASYNSAFGAYVNAHGDATVSNSGDIQSMSDDGAFGVVAFAYGDVSVSNSGGITADGYYAIGVLAGGKYNGAASVTNSGDINVASTAGGDAYGVYAVAYGPVVVNNSGTITATDDDYAVGVAMYSATSTMLVNSGTINTNALALDSQIAVRSGDSDDQIINTGTLQGALVTHGGDDQFISGNGGDWIVDNRSTDFGSGDDDLTIMAGGAIHMDEGAIYLGSSTAAGNSFSNDGTIFVSGASNLIDMGSGTPPPPLVPSQPVPGGMTALSLPAQSAVPSLNAIAFTNTGLIDFVDGMPDDMLTIVGDFAGSGDLNIDISVLTASSDILYVDGSIVDGSTQTVNVAYKGIPLPTDPDIAFAYVTGDSTADAFVGGQVLDLDPSNFITTKTTVTSTLDASNVTPDVFYIGVRADGLNDTGVLAASVASGAHSLINSQIGTWRQRVGVLPAQPEGGLSPWVRFFSDKGTIDPTSQSGFGSASNFSFDQDNWGRELGMNFNINGSFNYGVLLGKADGKQELNNGTGTDRLKLNTAGLYATWVSNGFYVDWSYRWMDFDAKLLSAAGEQRTSGNATASNIEAGYSWNVGGFDLIPQVQYTRTKLDNVDAVHGSLTDFESDGSVSERGRVGLGLSKTITNGNLIWTPYGSVNAIREFKGENRYTVADIYSGQTSTEGTSAMVELGVGLQTGGFSVTGGVNWTDGGALDSFVGGQVVLRYSW